MNELLEMAFQMNPAMMLIFSPGSGRIVAINQSCADRIGLPVAEISGSRIQELVDWVEPDDYQNMMDLLERDRKVSGYEALFHSADGEKWRARIFASIATSLPEPYAIATIEDITEHQRMEEALHRVEEFFRLLANCAGDVIWVMDLTGRFTYISPAVEHYLGYKPDEIIQQPFERLLTPDSATFVRAILEKTAAQVQAGRRVGCRRMELEPICKNGSTLWSEVNFCGLYSSTGEFMGLQGISRDITERKRAEDLLRKSEQMLDDMARNIPGVTFQLYARPDGAMGFYYLSPHADTMYNLSADWRLGLNVFPEDRTRLLESVEAAVHSGRPWSFEGRYLLKSGEICWLRGLAQPEQRKDEVVYNGVLLDITDLKRAEAALREEARRKDDFLMMLAHELRNPLAPIRNAVEVMKMAQGNEATQIRQQVLIERQVEHLARLVDDLLEMARITRGTIGLRKEKIALRNVVEQAIENSLILSSPRKDDFSCLMTEHNIFIEADYSRLAQVICNLLSNAVKFSESGQKIQLTVSLEAPPVSGRRPEAVIRIQDQGLGIDPELLPHIFDIFVQGDKSLDRSRGGLGLGLTLARRIVEMHGGRILASSAGLGKGSVFYLRLPVIADQEFASELTGPATQMKGPASGISPLAHRNKVLIVDDNVDMAKSLEELLQLWTFTVEVAYDGPQALNVFSGFSPGIVLLDIGLPRLDGFAVAREIRKRHEPEPLLLVAITGYGDDNDRSQSTQAGFDYHLTKPIDLAQLQGILERYRDTGS